MIKANGIEIKPTIFPDKTSQVWKIDESILNSLDINIEWDFENEAELIHLAQLMDLIKHEYDQTRYRELSLYMPYFPYARQDKKISNHTTFGKISLLNILVNMNFSKISAFDIHSNETYYFKDIESIPPKKEVMAAALTTSSNLFVYPDNGAKDKYDLSFKYYVDSIYAEKIRNQTTGEITSLELIGNCEGKKCLIVDDICDGGMTFIKLADLLYSKGATEVNLYISHGLFTKGIQVLKDANIKRIFTRKGEVK